MSPYKVNKTIAEINEKIRKGKAVVVTAEEIIDMVASEGAALKIGRASCRERVSSVV